MSQNLDLSSQAPSLRTLEPKIKMLLQKGDKQNRKEVQNKSKGKSESQNEEEPDLAQSQKATIFTKLKNLSEIEKSRFFLKTRGMRFS